MSQRLTDIRQAHVKARTLAKQRMQAYYPNEPQLYINRVDPIMWTILYQKALQEIKEKEGIAEYDLSAETKKRVRTPTGQFAPASTSQET